MKISGHVENNKIIIDENIELPDGMQVEIILPESAQSTFSGLCGIWEDERPVESIVEDIISARTIGRELDL